VLTQGAADARIPRPIAGPRGQAPADIHERDLETMAKETSIDTIFFDFDGTLVFYDPDSSDLISAFCTEIGQPLSEELTRRFQDLEPRYVCPEPGCKTLEELCARGYRLGLITNRSGVENFYLLLDRLELRPYFDLVLASGEVGVQKPDPGIFIAALEKMGARAESSLYIGDNYWADVIGAQRAGLTPMLLDPHHLFPEADCQILEQIDDVLRLIP
jgi:HAD superfamily hydrolase (TIGR01549 family)